MFRSLEYDVKVKGVVKKRQMTIGRFVKENPKGTFFMLVSGHAFTVKDGSVIGNWDDATKLRTRVVTAFEIK